MPQARAIKNFGGVLITVGLHISVRSRSTSPDRIAQRCAWLNCKCVAGDMLRFLVDDPRKTFFPGSPGFIWGPEYEIHRNILEVRIAGSRDR